MGNRSRARSQPKKDCQALRWWSQSHIIERVNTDTVAFFQRQRTKSCNQFTNQSLALVCVEGMSRIRNIDINLSRRQIPPDHAKFWKRTASDSEYVGSLKIHERMSLVGIGSVTSGLKKRFIRSAMTGNNRSQQTGTAFKYGSGSLRMRLIIG
jgi:hypothetical protein